MANEGVFQQAGKIRRPVSTSDSVQTPPTAVLQGIVRNPILPHPPDHPYPRPAKDAYGVRVVAATPARPEVERVLVGQRSAVASLAQRPVAACWPPRTAGRRRLIVALLLKGLAILALSRRWSGSLRIDPVWSKMPLLWVHSPFRKAEHR